MSIILWLILGALAGWLASLIVGKNRQMGALANIVVGLVGALVGGFVAQFLGFGSFSQFSIAGLLIAVGGSVIVLLVVNLLFHNKG